MHAQNISQIDTSEPVVCLTFDDGPTGANTLQILEILKAHDAKATFFVIGDKIEKEQDALKQVEAAGQEIGNHTFTHQDLAKLDSEATVLQELKDCQQEVLRATGVSPVVFRAPYLSQNEIVEAALATLSMPSILCSADTRDWDPESSAEGILERGIAGLEPGAVILMHEFSDKTVSILPKLLDEVKKKGLRAVTVSEALKLAE